MAKKENNHKIKKKTQLETNVIHSHTQKHQ